METDTPTARPAPAGGSALALAAAEQRGALMSYATRLLEGAAGAAGEVVETALRDVAAQPGEAGERMEEQVARTMFAAVRRGVLARLRSEGIVQRPAAPDGEAPGATLEERIERLTPKQREAVWLKFSHGFGYEAISGIAGLSLHNVSFLLHSALTNLREAMAADGKVPAADDARVTDYVLGEMNESERGAFEGSLGHDAAAKTAVAEVRALVGELAQTLGGGGTTARRAKPAAETGERKRKGLVILAGVVGVTILAGGAWWWRGQTRRTASTATELGEEFRMKPDQWKIGRTRVDGASEGGIAKIGAGEGISRIKVVEPFVAIPPHLKKGKAVEEKRAAKPAEEDARVWPRGGGGGGGNRALGGGTAAVVAGPAAALAAQALEVNGETGAGRGNSAAATVVEPGGGQSGGLAAPTQGGSKAVSLPAVPGGAGGTPAEVTRGGAAAATPRAESQPVAATAAGAKAGDGAAPAEAKKAARGEDPDTAAMATLRAAVTAKRWPEPAEVGTQALLNYFPGESTATVVSEAEVAVAVEVVEAPWAPERKLVRVVVRAAPPKTPRAAIANLVLLVDVSRSMDAPNRLPLVQEAARRLLHDLRAEDRVAIVTYAGEARVALPPTPMARAADVRAALAGLRAEGMTNGAAGLRRAYDLARAGFIVGGVNRVVLCTDGDFNMGVTSEAELGALVAAEAKGGIGLGVFGFGRGRAIDPRLEALATKGRGGSGHVNSRREAERRMATEVNGWNATEVRGVQLGLAGDPARIAASRLVGHDESFLPPEDAGRKNMEVRELAPGEAITALFEIVPKVGGREGTGTGARGEADWLTLNIGYRAGVANGGEARSVRVPVGESGRRWAEASAEFKFTAAVAGLGLALRERPVDRAKLAAIVRWAEEAAVGSGPDPGGYREEFLALVREVRELAK